MAFVKLSHWLSKAVNRSEQVARLMEISMVLSKLSTSIPPSRLLLAFKDVWMVGDVFIVVSFSVVQDVILFARFDDTKVSP